MERVGARGCSQDRKRSLMQSSIHPQNTRELLQYVPQVMGKTFVVEFRWADFSDSLKSELMLDLAMLQNIGVKLILIVEKEEVEDVLDWGLDVALRLENDIQTDAEGIRSVIQRGQFAIMASGEDYLEEEVVVALKALDTDKVLLLIGDERRELLEAGESFSTSQWSKNGFKEWSFHARVNDLLESGISRIHFLNAYLPSVILSEIFSIEGSGMMVYRDSYRLIRKMVPEDIPEVLTMIGRSVKTSLLVPREYEDIENLLEDYYVYQIDENVIGCAALHHHEGKSGEIACLYIKQGHQGWGYGEQLVKYLEERAREQEIVELFALTTGASYFFETRLKYQTFPQNKVPLSRLKALQESGRESLAFFKNLS